MANPPMCLPCRDCTGAHSGFDQSCGPCKLQADGAGVGADELDRLGRSCSNHSQCDALTLDMNGQGAFCADVDRGDVGKCLPCGACNSRHDGIDSTCGGCHRHREPRCTNHTDCSRMTGTRESFCGKRNGLGDKTGVCKVCQECHTNHSGVGET
jgi:hypothetical protein